MYTIRLFIFRVLRHFRNRFGILWYVIVQKVGKLINDFSLRVQIPNNFIASFRKAKEDAVHTFPSGDRIFAWALHELNGKIKMFNDFNDHSWKHWLNHLPKFQHFRWRVPNDLEAIMPTLKIKQMGRSTWSGLFKKYKLHNLDRHDMYSLPDVYYTIKIFGHIPQSVIDIGGGWGRLGMAWYALGSRVVGITDSIEQPYMMQHQYLSSVPGVDFYEALEKPNDASLDFKTTSGIIHFPLWLLPKISSDSIEAVSTIQVLREVSKECLEFLFSEVYRILKKGGVWYIRDNDHEYRETCMHNVRITDYLQTIGFKLAYKSDLIQGKDIHGVPRIFQKI